MLLNTALIVALSLAAYLIGSIPVGVIVGRLRGFDPRRIGSGNIGMTNVARAAGRGAAAITFAGDFLKGAIPVIAAHLLGLDATATSIVAFAAFAGAIFSAFLGFEGGRGISTSLGIWMVLAPAPALIALAIFLAVVAVTRIVSAGSLCAAIALPVTIIIMSLPHVYSALVIAMALLILFRHRENIQRLMAGEEPRLRKSA
ncbi:MAG: glycerol-3-phosphate 1-O-acyltransferase PlsY [Candidatus Binataceae bacterium]|nr:glycerol-3-phosphate 1-O-acyltransferase PlsY [Candidatus Binataceae bacterium]